ncbi:TetR/AcrR family transcriptional regulator [Flavobacterium sp. Fl-318]|uniref:TetR/AcrR family transcriptional regulator n=1 Tax=Flavobacterium cupriresistens TaxID=2893885 RepID=A0ABU4RG38_9FLAO|nr:MULTISPECIES: TetR/AcrR family transcriptional regulator [unclassified Flavobacterium]MDX6189481.1 TetR/AcrR family transcriptional regulator [Flavobacterium sp. Fl-318]UFH41110.1 TetR/AcrR family transcriptional regulator [Flavobacterium sp. F-323]
MRIRDIDKEKLVVARAIDQIVQDGFQGFSMNKLAKACNISVATLYIYYKDKDDLIQKIGATVAIDFFSSTIKDFSPEMSFEEGLWIQWVNRADFTMKYPKQVAFFEIIKHSPHGEIILNSTTKFSDFRMIMKQFIDNSLQNNELIPMSFEVFWAIAYGPLYTLLNFHTEGKSLGGKPFVLTDTMMKEAFTATIKALKP